MGTCDIFKDRENNLVGFDKLLNTSVRESAVSYLNEIRQKKDIGEGLVSELLGNYFNSSSIDVFNTITEEDLNKELDSLFPEKDGVENFDYNKFKNDIVGKSFIANRVKPIVGNIVKRILLKKQQELKKKKPEFTVVKSSYKNAINSLNSPEERLDYINKLRNFYSKFTPFFEKLKSITSEQDLIDLFNAQDISGKQYQEVLRAYAALDGMFDLRNFILNSLKRDGLIDPSVKELNGIFSTLRKRYTTESDSDVAISKKALEEHNRKIEGMMPIMNVLLAFDLIKGYRGNNARVLTRNDYQNKVDRYKLDVAATEPNTVKATFNYLRNYLKGVAVHEGTTKDPYYSGFLTSIRSTLMSMKNNAFKVVNGVTIAVTKLSASKLKRILHTKNLEQPPFVNNPAVVNGTLVDELYRIIIEDMSDATVVDESGKMSRPKIKKDLAIVKQKLITSLNQKQGYQVTETGEKTFVITVTDNDGGKVVLEVSDDPIIQEVENITRIIDNFMKQGYIPLPKTVGMGMLTDDGTGAITGEPDLLLLDSKTGEVVVVDFKTTGSKNINKGTKLNNFLSVKKLYTEEEQSNKENILPYGEELRNQIKAYRLMLRRTFTQAGRDFGVADRGIIVLRGSNLQEKKNENGDLVFAPTTDPQFAPENKWTGDSDTFEVDEHGNLIFGIGGDLVIKRKGPDNAGDYEYVYKYDGRDKVAEIEYRDEDQSYAGEMPFMKIVEETKEESYETETEENKHTKLGIKIYPTNINYINGNKKLSLEGKNGKVVQRSDNSYEFVPDDGSASSVLTPHKLLTNDQNVNRYVFKDDKGNIVSNVKRDKKSQDALDNIKEGDKVKITSTKVGNLFVNEYTTIVDGEPVLLFARRSLQNHEGDMVVNSSPKRNFLADSKIVSTLDQLKNTANVIVNKINSYVSIAMGEVELADPNALFAAHSNGQIDVAIGYFNTEENKLKVAVPGESSYNDFIAMVESHKEKGWKVQIIKPNPAKKFDFRKANETLRKAVPPHVNTESTVEAFFNEMVSSGNVEYLGRGDSHVYDIDLVPVGNEADGGITLDELLAAEDATTTKIVKEKKAQEEAEAKEEVEEEINLDLEIAKLEKERNEELRSEENLHLADQRADFYRELRLKSKEMFSQYEFGEELFLEKYKATFDEYVPYRINKLEFENRNNGLLSDMRNAEAREHFNLKQYLKYKEINARYDAQIEALKKKANKKSEVKETNKPKALSTSNELKLDLSLDLTGATKVKEKSVTVTVDGNDIEITESFLEDIIEEQVFGSDSENVTLNNIKNLLEKRYRNDSDVIEAIERITENHYPEDSNDNCTN